MLSCCCQIVVVIVVVGLLCTGGKAHNLKGRQSSRRRPQRQTLFCECRHHLDSLQRNPSSDQSGDSSPPSPLLLSLLLLQLHSVAGSALQARLQLFSCDHKNWFSGETDCSLSGATIRTAI